jgi:hypothetical protein
MPPTVDDTEVLAISGAAGVGKSSTAYEISELLSRAGIAHALIDTDELDRIVPVPDDVARLSERNLAAVWAGFHERGIRRLILVGVFLHRPSELPWIRRAVPNAHITLVRLVASEATLKDRIARREVGSGGAAQLARTQRQLEVFAAETRPDVHLVTTDGRSIHDVAAELVRLSGWLDTE